MDRRDTPSRECPQPESETRVSLPAVSDVFGTVQSMGNKIGYARVSTTEQDPALQHDALTRDGCYTVYTDVASGFAG